jgi:hypothetical protein
MWSFDRYISHFGMLFTKKNLATLDILRQFDIYVVVCYLFFSFWYPFCQEKSGNPGPSKIAEVGSYKYRYQVMRDVQKEEFAKNRPQKYFNRKESILWNCFVEIYVQIKPNLVQIEFYIVTLYDRSTSVSNSI